MQMNMQLVKTTSKLRFSSLLMISFSCLILNSCTNQSNIAMSYSVPDVHESQEVSELKKESKILRENHTVTLSAVGDLMFHRYQLTRAYSEVTSSFEFDDAFKYVKPYLESSDYTVGNLETTLAGENGSRDFNVAERIAGYSGYPCFNTPDEVVKTIKDSGFDLLTTANNHSLDSYTSGLKRTLDVLDEEEILHIGTYRNQEEALETCIVEINEIDFAFLGFTYGMNGFSVPEEENYLINHLNMYEKTKIEEMVHKVEKAYEEEPDFIVVMVHFGNEYMPYQNSYQEDIVNQLFEAGADVILGSHPHVLQPIEIRKLVRSNGQIDTGIVIYSMGNFISSQKYESGMHKDLGVIFNVHFEKTDHQNGVIRQLSFVPTYTYWNDQVIGILPVDETLNFVQNGKISLADYDRERLEFAKTYVPDHLMSYLPEDRLMYEDYYYTLKLEGYE